MVTSLKSILKYNNIITAIGFTYIILKFSDMFPLFSAPANAIIQAKFQSDKPSCASIYAVYVQKHSIYAKYVDISCIYIYYIYKYCIYR